MRVLHLIACLEAGGIEKWLLSMLQEMNRAECALDFCCKLRDGYLAEEARSLGAKVTTNLFTPSHIPYGRQLAHILQEGKYDLIHSHMETLSGLPVLVARRLGIPIISSFHNTQFPPGEQSRHSRLLVGLRGSYSRLSIGYALRYSDSVTGCSRAVLESLAPDYGRRPNFRVLYYGVPVPPPRPASERIGFRQELGWPDQVPVILHVGRFAEQKNHAGLLRIFQRVLATVPEAKLILVGDGALRGEIEAQIAEAGIQESVRLLGLRNDVPRVMTLCDAFLFPSRHEGLPVSAIEASAAALPIVGSTIPGLDEVVSDGETALLHAPDDVEGMACSVVKLLTEREFARKIGDAGRRRVEKEFSLAASAGRLRELYYECSGHRQRAYGSHARR
jgi:glycosyltransferase EpsF